MKAILVLTKPKGFRLGYHSPGIRHIYMGQHTLEHVTVAVSPREVLSLAKEGV